MASLFTQEDFDILCQMAGKEGYKGDAKHSVEYAQLVACYDKIDEVAKKLVALMRLNGLEPEIKVRRAPKGDSEKGRGNTYKSYVLAKLLPKPKENDWLVYTIEISTGAGWKDNYGAPEEPCFAVKIDRDGNSKNWNLHEDNIRNYGRNSSNHVYAILPKDQVITMDADQLAKWAYQEINRFHPNYDEIYNELKELMEMPTTTTPSTPPPSTPPINKIYYGPPGTGKTYKIQQLLKDYVTEKDNPQVRFNRIIQEIQENTGLTWKEITYITLYYLREIKGEKTVKNSEIAKHPFIKAKPASNNFIKSTISNALQTNATHNKWRQLSGNMLWFDKDEKLGWFIANDQGEDTQDLRDLVDGNEENPPETEERYAEERYEFVTFHQSYGYEEFMEGIAPKLDEHENNGQVRYEIKNGVFKNICIRAQNDPDNQYAIFIDEINRGNISRIFGELISLIETDKRQGRENALSLTLPFSQTEFSVPANLDIYGTMNTADRSLALLDTALRRRFQFEEMLPQYDLLDPDFEGIDLQTLLKAINARIVQQYDRDHQIGHAYLMHIDDFDGLKDAFQFKILPLLQEYFFDDWSKIGTILNKNNFVAKGATEFDLKALKNKENYIKIY